MQIMITVPDALIAQVQSRGLDAEAYAQELMDQAASQELAKTEERREAVEAMLRFAGERKLTLRSGPSDSTLHEERLEDETPEENELRRGERHQAAVDAMLRFGEEHRLSLGGDDLKSMVHEGHKY